MGRPIHIYTVFYHVVGESEDREFILHSFEDPEDVTLLMQQAYASLHRMYSYGRVRFLGYKFIR